MDVQYAQLSDFAVLRNIWRFLVGPGFDAERTRKMLDLNVQRANIHGAIESALTAERTKTLLAEAC